jgi:hypothetical protein
MTRFGGTLGKWNDRGLPSSPVMNPRPTQPFFRKPYQTIKICTCPDNDMDRG